MRIRRGWKRCIRRHQVQSGASADAQDRAIESTERQEAAKEIERELEDLEQGRMEAEGVDQ